MRRAFGDMVISLGAVLVLLITLVSVDPRVRQELSPIWEAPGTSALTMLSRQLGEVSSVVVSVARDQGIANAPLMIFALAASVLLLFMLRT